MLPRSAEKTTGSNVLTIGGNLHRDCVYCMKLILKELCEKNNAKLKNTTKMFKLRPKNLVRCYSFADIMTREKYVAFKIVACSRSGNFKYGCQYIIQSDMFSRGL